MSEFAKYLGFPYREGKHDCYSVLRNILRDRWAIRLPNFARPTEFWSDPNLDLYSMYAEFGFRQVFDQPFEVGDVLLMPLGTAMNSHAVMVLEDNKILHHLPGQLSSLDPLMPKWGRRGNIVLRHPDVSEKNKNRVETVHLHEVADAEIFRNPRVKDVITRAVDAELGEVRGDKTPPGDPRNEEPVPEP